MTLEEAKILLGKCRRTNYPSRTFWCDVYGIEVAFGHFTASYSFVESSLVSAQWKFTAEQAQVLRGCGGEVATYAPTENAPKNVYLEAKELRAALEDLLFVFDERILKSRLCENARDVLAKYPKRP
jgi:hypothetical protein